MDDSEQLRSRNVLNDLLDLEEGLSCKELEFIDSMDKKRDRTWSKKQIKWLDDIYKRVC